MPPGRPLEMSRRTALYRLYDEAAQLLYVGIAFDPRVRGYHHKKHKPWWPDVARREVEWFENRHKAEAAERQAIATEKPRYNVAGVPNPLLVEVVAPSPPPPLSPAIAEGLRKAARASRRADRAADRARQALRETILEAASKGMGPTQIVKAIDYAYTPAHVSRMIHGKA